MRIIPRITLLERIRALVRSSPVTALLGPRQSGKTTLARQALAAVARGERFDLEDPRDLQRLHEPMTALEALYVVYPGPKRYALAKRVEVLPIAELPAVLPLHS